MQKKLSFQSGPGSIVAEFSVEKISVITDVDDFCTYIEKSVRGNAYSIFDYAKRLCLCLATNLEYTLVLSNFL